MEEIRKDVLNLKDIAYMMDPSVLKLDSCLEDVEAMIADCRKYSFGTCFAWPCYYERMYELLKGADTKLGVSLAFPSGQESTYIKQVQAELFMKYEPAEVDMVMNIGLLKSGKFDACVEDIRAVREITKGTSLKVIIEAMLLSDEEIRTACKLVGEGGANYVKTGTGFSVGNPTTLHHVKVIKDTIGDDLKLKVAGGVRDLDTMLKMYKLGACRFGIGYSSALKIFKQAADLGKDIRLEDVVVE